MSPNIDSNVNKEIAAMLSQMPQNSYFDDVDVAQTTMMKKNIKRNMMKKKSTVIVTDNNQGQY